MDNPELEFIKKKYGEAFAKLCRDLCPTILEVPGELTRVITTYFSPSRFLCEDIVSGGKEIQFRRFVYEHSCVELPPLEATDKTVYELFREAGYTLTKCETYEEMAPFAKYFSPKELLCSFNDYDRPSYSTVFFAVRDGAENLRREDFTNPQREDAYGTSVISIQFSDHYVDSVSIKNRYNHSVKNPDATFSNNLERIAKGLTFGFIRDFGFKESAVNESLTLLNYTTDKNGKFYKYNYAWGRTFFCANNIMIVDKVVQRNLSDDPSRSPSDGSLELIDYFLLDRKEKKISVLGGISDSFPESMPNIQKITKTVNKTDGSKDYLIEYLPDGMTETLFAGFTVSAEGKILKYYNPNITVVAPNFLTEVNGLQEIEMPNLEHIGSCFLEKASGIKKIYFPKLKTMGDWCLRCTAIEEMYLDSLVSVGEHCLSAIKVKNVSFPKLETAGTYFLSCASEAETFYAPLLRSVGDNLFQTNDELTELILPSIEEIGSACLNNNHKIARLYLPKLRTVKDSFLPKIVVKTAEFPSLEKVGWAFLSSASKLRKISLPRLKIADGAFLSETQVEDVDLPELEVCGSNAFSGNRVAKRVNVPSLIEAGCGFFEKNDSAQELNIPKLRFMGNSFMANNNTLKSLRAPELQRIGLDCFALNEVLEDVYLPSIVQIGSGFAPNSPAVIGETKKLSSDE